MRLLLWLFGLVPDLTGCEMYEDPEYGPFIICHDDWWHPRAR